MEDRRETRCVALRPGSPVSPPVQYSNILVKRAVSDREGSDDRTLAALIPIIALISDIAQRPYELSLLHLVWERGSSKAAYSDFVPAQRLWLEGA